MSIVDNKKTPNLIINLLYLRDYTNADPKTFGKRLNKSQEQIDVLLMVLTNCTIRI